MASLVTSCLPRLRRNLDLSPLFLPYSHDAGHERMTPPGLDDDYSPSQARVNRSKVVQDHSSRGLRNRQPSTIVYIGLLGDGTSERKRLIGARRQAEVLELLRQLSPGGIIEQELPANIVESLRARIGGQRKRPANITWSSMAAKRSYQENRQPRCATSRFQLQSVFFSSGFSGVFSISFLAPRFMAFM